MNNNHKNILFAVLFVIIMFLVGPPAMAQSNEDVNSENANGSLIQKNLVNSLTLSFGAMGYAYKGYGTALDMTYYRQMNNSNHSRWGLSLRWFHDFNHGEHYLEGTDEEDASEGYLRYLDHVQIDMLSIQFHLQGYKRYGNWELSIDGGFGAGFTLATDSRYKSRLKEHPNEDLGGLYMDWIFYAFAGHDWDIFLDVSATGVAEYYISDNFSLGLNLSVHYHTLLYIDGSASIQFKVLF